MLLLSQEGARGFDPPSPPWQRPSSPPRSGPPPLRPPPSPPLEPLSRLRQRDGDGEPSQVRQRGHEFDGGRLQQQHRLARRKQAQSSAPPSLPRRRSSGPQSPPAATAPIGVPGFSPYPFVPISVPPGDDPGDYTVMVEILNSWVEPPENYQNRTIPNADETTYRAWRFQMLRGDSMCTNNRGVVGCSYSTPRHVQEMCVILICRYTLVSFERQAGGCVAAAV